MQQADSSNPYIDPYNVKEVIRGGDSLLYVLNFQNGSGGTDVTQYQFVFTAKRSKQDADSQAVAQTFFTCIPGTDSQNGVVAFEAITKDQSAIMPWDETYVMDIRYMTPANHVATIVEGELTVLTPVSRNVTPP